MNASRLREIVELLLDRETKFRIQPILSEVNNALTSLASNLQDQNFQTQYAAAVEKLRTAVTSMAASITPAEMKELEEVGAQPYFSVKLPENIQAWVLENPISPVVAQQKVAQLFADRNSYIQTITQIRDNFAKLKIEPHRVNANTAEIGFLIPRDLFKNELEQLIKELGVINRILRAFSELATTSVAAVEVREISTTDPLFFFGLDPLTIAALGGAVTWALKQWELVEKIRKLRSETKKNETFSDDEIKDFFDSKIEKTIEAAVAEKVAELMKDTKDKPGRTKEQEIDLTWALKSLLARIERGMTVEIRYLAPPPKPAVEGQPAEENRGFADIEKIVPQLVFPPRESSPVLELPPPEPPKLAKVAKSSS
jgi:hypothetical protein